MNINLIFNIPIPNFLNETNSLEIIDLDNDYNIIDNLYQEPFFDFFNKHNYILNNLRDLNWELRRIYHSIRAYYHINFDNNQEYLNYIYNSLKISIYYHYRNDIITNENIIIDNIDNQNNLLINEEELNIKNYDELEIELRNKYTECNICYNNFNNNTKIVILNCIGNHIYCYECIINWLKNYNNNCPICKN